MLRPATIQEIPAPADQAAVCRGGACVDRDSVMAFSGQAATHNPQVDHRHDGRRWLFATGRRH